MTRRRKAREFALQLLFRIDMSGEAADEALFSDFFQAGDVEAPVRDFAVELVRGAWQHRGALDKAIGSAAEHWSLGRIAAVDRALLRLGAFELLHRPDIPPSVTINEALEIAKKFSTAEAAAFINGILDRIAASGPAGDGTS